MSIWTTTCHRTPSETPEIVEECVSLDVASTVHSTQRTHNAVSIDVGVAKRAVGLQSNSHLRSMRRRPKAIANASQLDARLKIQHRRPTSTSLTERVAPKNNPSLENAASLYPQALILPPFHSSTTGSADRRSIAASSGLLSPSPMPNFHQAGSRSAKGWQMALLTRLHAQVQLARLTLTKSLTSSHASTTNQAMTA